MNVVNKGIYLDDEKEEDNGDCTVWICFEEGNKREWQRGHNCLSHCCLNDVIVDNFCLRIVFSSIKVFNIVFLRSHERFALILFFIRFIFLRSSMYWGECFGFIILNMFFGGSVDFEIGALFVER